MSVTVKFFARLREELNIDEVQIDAQHNLTALEVWQKVTGQSSLPPKILIAINQQYANEAEYIKENDEIAFFPPVTGG